MIVDEKIIIRKAEKEDIVEIANIKIDGWKEAYKGIIEEEFLNNMDIKKEVEKRKKDYNQNGFIVAILDKEVVGFCRYIDSNEFSSEYEDIDCELCAIYVKPTFYEKMGGKVFDYKKVQFGDKEYEEVAFVYDIG